jgi:DNA-directed RNA polymerase subunit L
MPIKVLLNEGRELRLRMEGESHTTLQLFRSRLNGSKDVEYSNYFQNHPDVQLRLVEVRVILEVV